MGRLLAELYLSGKSLKDIAEMLTAKHIEYMSGKTDWNRSRIKRIVEDKRYIGDGGYPPILTEQEYAAMQSIKAEKNTQKNVNHTEGIFTLNAPVVCPNCGGRMHRRFDRRRKANTWWQCSECKASVNMSDENMLNGITELLNEVITDPECIRIPKSDYEESQEIKRLNAEIADVHLSLMPRRRAFPRKARRARQNPFDTPESICRTSAEVLQMQRLKTKDTPDGFLS